MMYSNCQY